MMSAAASSSRRRTPWRSARTSGRSIAGLRMSPSSPPGAGDQHRPHPLGLVERHGRRALGCFVVGMGVHGEQAAVSHARNLPAPPRAAPQGPGRCVTSGTMRASRRPTTVLMALLAVLGVTVVASACGTSGRTLRDPQPGATAPPRKGASTTSTTAGSALQAVPGAALSISTTAWTAGEEIPQRFTCDGPAVSPPLTITGAPEGTVELVVVVSDQDAGGFLHWVVAGVPPGAPSFPQDGLPAGAIEAPNSSGGVGWFGPCPPAGATHTYDFTVYALHRGLGPERQLHPGPARCRTRDLEQHRGDDGHLHPQLSGSGPTGRCLTAGPTGSIPLAAWPSGPIPADGTDLP